MLLRKQWLGFLIMMVGLAGCGLVEAPEQLPIPTPVATAVSFDASQFPAGEMVIDPVSDVVPRIDPHIAGLVDSVSQQQLTGYVQTMQSFGNRNVFSVTDDPNFGIGATRQWLVDEFTRVGNGRLQVNIQEFPIFYNGLATTPYNVVATLPGRTESQDIIVVMAHYDNRAPEPTDGETYAPGANDNGSGIALLLETARLLSSFEWNQTIVFLAAAAEEQGTFGSRHFVQTAFLEGTNIIAAINYDAVGGRSGIPQYARLFAYDLTASPAGELARYYEYVAGLYVPQFPVQVINALDREGRWGDHREFVNAGMPGIRVIESVEDPDMVNSRTDTWDRIDYNYLQQVVQMNVAVVANLAGAPQTPQTPLIQALDSPGDFWLRWQTDPDAAGYAISFRPITEGSFTTFRFVRGSQAGNVALTGMDPNTAYAVSVTALDENGRLGDFTPEVIVEPNSASAQAP
ncbi:MAG: M20/M25/M40 family metallo-hydrolase [Ardenticatenaceae bacterium]|nr:M28 family metallopeptidase [Anaerolineales bacterium]MCB8938275.1 M20/M25/M40 family metallo-hydrolase [Ardenticatenaceae bacterium]MCB8975640.1 M20/M25/M40 family metallo-hydrolase [Ardenticatenaceae bacterium]